MTRFGPTRAEWRFRLIFSLCGLAMLVGGLIYRRAESFGPGAWEAIIIAALFFGGSAVYSARKLLKGPD